MACPVKFEHQQWNFSALISIRAKSKANSRASVIRDGRVVAEKRVEYAY